MSKWSGECDFRDILEIFYHDDFNAFMKGTGGYIRKYVDDDSSIAQHIKITCPADLIPYYPYPSAHQAGQLTDGVYKMNICLSNDYRSSQTKHYKTIYKELLELYNLESKKPIEEQKIL